MTAGHSWGRTMVMCGEGQRGSRRGRTQLPGYSVLRRPCLALLWPICSPRCSAGLRAPTPLGTAPDNCPLPCPRLGPLSPPVPTLPGVLSEATVARLAFLACCLC